MAEILLQQNAYVDQIDFFERTPLMIAVKNSNIEAVNLLLKNGANHQVKNLIGKTPLQIASQKIEDIKIEHEVL